MFHKIINVEALEDKFKAMSEEELKSLPEKLDITCHMCGRVFTVSTRA